MVDKLSLPDWMRLRDWFADPNRKPANIAFTAGAARDAATAFEASGLPDNEKRLKETLRPFADHAALLAKCPQANKLPDTCPLQGPNEEPGAQPTIGDCRAAARLLYGDFCLPPES